jgi:SAM-dependent MidA family methyltransferase
VDDPGDPDLFRRILDEIASDGPLPFSRFMELALYDPERGYYMARPRLGREGGDFWTAPEIDPVFGEMIGVQAEEMARRLGMPDRFTIREHGGGTGALAAALLASWQRSRSPLFREGVYEIVEISPTLRERQREALAPFGGAARIVSTDAIEAGAPDAPGIVLMNEVLDALPVDRVRGGTGGRIEEIRVGEAGGRLVEVTVPAQPDLCARLEEALAAGGHRLEEGQEVEVRRGLGEHLHRAVRTLSAGYLMVLDYGMEAAALYHPSRRAGTLMSYAGHRASPDLLSRVGRQDLTAHVDLSALRRAADTLGFVPAPSTTQMKFLLALGLLDRVAALDNADLPPARREERRSSMLALIRPGGMGEMFHVFIAARGAGLDLTGLRNPFGESLVPAIDPAG